MREPWRQPRRIPARALLFTLALLALGIGAGTAGAQNPQNKATVTAAPDFAADKLGGTGTFRLFSFSKQSQSLMPPVAAAGPNATTSITTVLNGVAGTLPGREGPSIIVSTGVVGANPVKMLYGDKEKLSPRTEPFGPTFTNQGALQKSILRKPGDNVTVTSTSGIYKAESSAYITNTGERRISAETATTAKPPPSGSVAAQAIDPFAVPSDTAYAYTPRISGSVEFDSAEVTGGFGAYALDSHTFTAADLDDFVDAGSPLDETLWYLSVGADITPNGDFVVFVDFQLNPVALDEILFPSSFLATLEPYSNAVEEARLISRSISATIAGNLDVNGHTATLDDVQIMPLGTMFLAVDGGVTYASGIASVVNVPAPAPIFLLAFGMAGLAVMRRPSVVGAGRQS